MIYFKSGMRGFVGGAIAGAAVALTGVFLYSRRSSQRDAPTDAHVARMQAKGKVWGCIGGAMQSAQLYLGDRLELYSTLRELCCNGTVSTTAQALAQKTELSERWVAEWCAQQASMGILQLQTADVDAEEDKFGARLPYILPEAYCDVLANPSSTYYDISTVMPECFKTGIGRPYDEQDVATGCGGGNLLIAMAKEFPASTFIGYEVSDPALELAHANILESGLQNVQVVDARVKSLGESGPFDVVTTFDVLHDAPYPSDLIAQVKRALKSDGTWLLGDMAGKDSVEENICQNVAAPVMFSFSTCLCMSCATTEPDGEALGTLGFNTKVAKVMLNDGGFSKVDVLLEYDMTRWFEVAH